MSMGIEKIAAILMAVNAATADGRIKWESDIFSSAEFVTYTRRNKITLRRTQSGPFDEWDYHLGICRPTDNKPLEEFSDLDIKKYVPDALLIFENLYKTAKWQALGLDLEINNILQDL